MTDANALGNANIAFDYENNCIWAYSYNKNSSADNYQKARISKFAIPPLYDGNNQIISEVYLTDSDILDSFQLDYMAKNSQGGFIKNGKLVLAQGFESEGYIYLRVINLLSKKLVSVIDLLNSGFTEEPQGVFCYEDSIFYTTGSASRFYKLFFD